MKFALLCDAFGAIGLIAGIFGALGAGSTNGWYDPGVRRSVMIAEVSLVVLGIGLIWTLIAAL